MSEKLYEQEKKHDEEYKTKPNIVIKTNGVTGTKVYVNGEELKGVSRIKFTQSYKENSGLPMLQIDLRATDVTLETKMIPALPKPFDGFYISTTELLNSGIISQETAVRLCQECGIDVNDITQKA